MTYAMNHPTQQALLWSLTFAILVLTGVRASHAHARRVLSRLILNTTEAQARELVQRRSLARESSLPSLPPPSSRAEGGLAGKVARALADAGLPASALQSLSPEAESTDKGVVRQHATLTLSGPSLPQVGRFMDAWRTAEPQWIISGLDLSPAGTAAPGADVPLRTVITLDAVFRGRFTIPAGGQPISGDRP